MSSPQFSTDMLQRASGSLYGASPSNASGSVHPRPPLDSAPSSASTITPVKKQKPYYYHQLFNKVLRTRLRYVDRIAVILAVLVSLFLALPSGTLITYLLVVPVRSAFLWLGFHLIKSSREIHARVDYLPHKTLAGRVSSELFGWNFVSVVIGFGISAVLHYFFLYLTFASFPASIETKTRGKALVNDEIVFYQFYVALVALGYSVRHVVADGNRLRFKFAVARVDPHSVYLSQGAGFVLNALYLSGGLTLAAPVVYFFIRFAIYRALLVPLFVCGYSTAIPPFSVSMGLLCLLFVHTVVLTLCWELLNHFFNVYAQVGCLDGKKPLSAFSNDPVNTLLTGLRDKNPLVCLTAFQELAYLATADDRKGREPFYAATHKSNFVWLAILQECSGVIKEVCRSINSRAVVTIETKDTFEERPSIFGNAQRAAGDTQPLGRPSGAEPHLLQRRSRSPAADYYVRQPVKTRSETLKENLQRIKNEDLPPAQAFFHSVFQQGQALYTAYFTNFLHTTLGLPFRTTVTLDVESRVGNATNFGNAIVAMSYLMWNAPEEDALGIVSGSLTEVLVLLERVVSACASYVDHPPAYVYVPATGPEPALGMAVLHDLAMECFFQLAVKYNDSLNDLLLPPAVFRLAKLTIDNAIEDQQRRAAEGS